MAWSNGVEQITTPSVYTFQAKPKGRGVRFEEFPDDNMEMAVAYYVIDCYAYERHDVGPEDPLIDKVLRQYAKFYYERCVQMPNEKGRPKYVPDLRPR